MDRHKPTCRTDSLSFSPPVVPDVLEEVEGLLQAVGVIVLSDHHVVAATGHHEDDGRYV